MMDLFKWTLVGYEKFTSFLARSEKRLCVALGLIAGLK
jgi:hypothetical protein